jgi:hypothetical protein
MLRHNGPMYAQHNIHSHRPLAKTNQQERGGFSLKFTALKPSDV